MTLTTEIAEKNVGRYIDCYKRIHGYYPKQIIRLKNDSGDLAVKDATGTCVKISSVVYGDAQYYDYIFEMVADES